MPNVHLEMHDHLADVSLDIKINTNEFGFWTSEQSACSTGVRAASAPAPVSNYVSAGSPDLPWFHPQLVFCAIAYLFPILCFCPIFADIFSNYVREKVNLSASPILILK